MYSKSSARYVLDSHRKITSCLRAAIEDASLSNEAFGAWMTLVKTLDEEDIRGLIDPTFAIVAQHWELFSSEIQQDAHDLISALLKTHQSMVRDMVYTIPSLGDIPLLKKFESDISKIKAQMDPRHQFQAFASRCRSENSTVVARALTELYTYLQKEQAFLHNSAISEQPDAVIGALLRSLLDACFRFSETSTDVAVDAARCLGLIGCIDPTMMEIPQEKKEIFVLSDFTNVDETIDFVVFFLQEILVKTFLSTTDTRSQGLLAYAIQELLRNCGFEVSNTVRRDPEPDDLYRRWIAIPESTKNTLSPFLTSRYVLEPLSKSASFKYPMYTPNMTHATWIRQFVFDLLGKSRGKNATMIFSICRRVIRRQDISIPTFLLPFITLNIVLQGLEKEIDEISAEFEKVLSYPLPENNHSDHENLLSCSHVSFTKPFTCLHTNILRTSLEQSIMPLVGCTKRRKVSDPGHGLAEKTLMISTKQTLPK